MMRLVYSWLLLALPASAGEARFRHHFIDKTLPQNDRLQGDYGLTAVTDLDREGGLDFVLGGRQPAPDRLYCCGWRRLESSRLQWRVVSQLPLLRRLKSEESIEGCNTANSR